MTETYLEISFFEETKESYRQETLEAVRKEIDEFVDVRTEEKGDDAQLHLILREGWCWCFVSWAVVKLLADGIFPLRSAKLCVEDSSIVLYPTRPQASS